MNDVVPPCQAATLDAIEQSPGVTAICKVANSDCGGLFAAKWNLDQCRIRTGALGHAILACRTAGNAMITRRAEDGCIRRRATVGATTFIAASSVYDWLSDGRSQSWHVYVRPDVLDRAARELGCTSRPRVREFFAEQDPWLKGYFQMLASEFEVAAEAGHALDALFLSQTEHVLVHHLLQCHSDGQCAHDLHDGRGVNPLRTPVMRRVQEYIDANLARRIRLGDLTGIAHLSSGHFMRAFRASTGTTPYQYVLEQRLAKARLLLQSTDVSISRVATECGFASPSHLCSKFRGRTGASPSEYRASVRGAAHLLLPRAKTVPFPGVSLTSTQTVAVNPPRASDPIVARNGTSRTFFRYP
ncbi:MAG TPA: AraC family transcriptional regulator [Casimicrobiaceae bacterium]|nr:AraC family transcriptional regulator [Casimicrobiaceae bacterium]